MCIRDRAVTMHADLSRLRVDARPQTAPGGGRVRVSGRPFAIVDEGHGYDVFGANAAWVRRAQAVTKVVHDRWFRVDSNGAHHIPAEGPAILVANHGGTLPIDAVMLWTDVLARTGRLLRPVADHFVQRLPFVGTLTARTGSIGGTRG